jgi:septin family protein
VRHFADFIDVPYATQIMQDIEHYGIQVYNFPFDPEEDDDELIAQNSTLRVSQIPQLISESLEKQSVEVWIR